MAPQKVKITLVSQIVIPQTGLTKTYLLVMELQSIQTKIHTIRGERVMLDFDLAELYEVQTKVLNQAVKRNIERFPGDFMFQLTWQEWSNLKSQIVTSSWGGARKRPSVFTEQGVAMLSAVLRSKKAILTSVVIMRAFVALRRYALTFDEITIKVIEHDKEIADIHEALRQLAPDNPDPDACKNRPRIIFLLYYLESNSPKNKRLTI